VGVEPVLLDRLILGAETARSDALIVLADGRLVAARTFGGKDAATSVGSLSAAITDLAHGQRDFPGGIRLSPSELAALGQAIIDGGKWTGEPTVPAHWMSALAPPAESAPARPSPLWNRELDPTDVDHKRFIGFGCITSTNEALLVFPEARLVVVRTTSRTDNQYDRPYDSRDLMVWLSQMADCIAVEKLGRGISVK
jgi:CubicO group peptidase (beta-lactamase class C family)